VTQQAQPNATDRRRVLERNHAEVVALLASGATQPEIAQRFGVARSTVLRFVGRNGEEIAQKRRRVDLAVEDYAIASKVFRIGELDHLYAQMRGELDKYGMFVVEESEDDNGLRVLTRDFRAQMVKELKGTLRQAAEELAQLPRPTVEVSDRRTYVLQVVMSENSGISIPLG
jgi:hypothetical protein